LEHIKDRIRTIRDAFSFSQRQIADKIGCNFRSWQDYEAGKTIPGGLIISELVKLGVNANWLLSGEGAMLISNITDSSITEDLIKIKIYKDIKKDEADADALSKVYISRKLFTHIQSGYATGDWGIVEIKDNSMKPTLKRGDMVLVDFSIKGLQNGIMAFIYNGVEYIRRIIPDFDGCEIVSDNSSSYNSVRVDSEKMKNIEVKGKIVKIVSRSI